jgi:DegV family protein with EDD domain
VALRPRLHTFAVLPTLKYLAMGGRVGKLAAGMADTFNIRPLLTVKDGKLDLLEKVRTTRKATSRLQELLCASAGGKKIAQLALIHVNNPQGAAELEASLRAALCCPEITVTADFTPGLSVHAGEGVVGAVLLTE